LMLAVVLAGVALRAAPSRLGRGVPGRIAMRTL
jgi:hypothetical protein